MKGLALARTEDQQVCLSGIDWVTAACLLEVPGTLPLGKSGPPHDRLFPRVNETEEKLNEDWRSYVTPELEVLFAEAGQVLARDIEPLARTGDDLKARSLTFPINHCDAWMSAINQARLILGAQHGVADKDMEEREFVEADDPKKQAVLRIHVLGYVLQVFVEFLAGEGM